MYVSCGYLDRSACSTLSSVEKAELEANAIRILSSIRYAQGNPCLNKKMAKVRFGFGFSMLAAKTSVLRNPHIMMTAVMNMTKRPAAVNFAVFLLFVMA